MPGAPSSFLLLVVRPGAPSSVLLDPEALLVTWVDEDSRSEGAGLAAHKGRQLMATFGKFVLKQQTEAQLTGRC